MRKQVAAALLSIVTLGMPLVAQAQVVNGTVNGANRGADEGEDIAGPLGGIVGGAIGAGVGAATGAVGTAGRVVGGVLDVEERPRFRDWVLQERHPSYRYARPVRVGVVLPRAGVTYYDVPGEYRARPGYRYTVINERPVLVDPRTRRVVDIID